MPNRTLAFSVSRHRFTMYSASHSEEAEGAAAVWSTVSDDWAEAPAAARRARDQTNFMLTIYGDGDELLIKGLKGVGEDVREKNGIKPRRYESGEKAKGRRGWEVKL